MRTAGNIATFARIFLGHTSQGELIFLDEPFVLRTNEGGLRVVFAVSWYEDAEDGTITYLMAWSFGEERLVFGQLLGLTLEGNAIGILPDEDDCPLGKAATEFSKISLAAVSHICAGVSRAQKAVIDFVISGGRRGTLESFFSR